MKDLKRFYSSKAEEKYKEFIEPWKILDAKGFQFLKQPTGMMNNICTAIARRGWIEFCAYPRDPVLPIVKEFYLTMLQQDQHNIFVTQVQVPLDSRVINTFYNLPAIIDCEYLKFAQNMSITISL